MRKRISIIVSVVTSLACCAFAGNQPENQNPPIYIAFLWHMHQPIYWPYESVTQTDQNARYSYSVVDIHNQRTGPYTSWPANAVQKGVAAGLQNFGAQVSFSGSLVENLNTLESAGNGNFSNWKSSWSWMKTQLTSLGNPRLDMVGFGYHHPLLGLIDYTDSRKQIQYHKQIFASNFSGTYSKGIFPPENAFSPREIPALVDEGLEWALVDNVHFDRAASGYPFSTSGNLYEPNKADIRNPNPNDWIQLNGLWAPTQTSARWGRQPHYVEYIDPSTGISKKIIAVPCDRYMGNEDGRGGFGALNYEGVMSQLESYNTDPNHPILIVLHHDGDNYGGGSESYYNNNFQNFVDWLVANPSRFVCTTVQDYLELFPPDADDVIHIEDGSWSGADNGDPEFKKWNGDPSGGYSPDRNSWGIITAAKNFVLTAEQINPSSANTQNAWKYFLNGEASDYWYWDGSQNGIWDSHPARASNLAIPYAQAVIATGTDLTPPTVYLPQREPYNPGGTEWGMNQPNNFTVWTYAYDVSGLSSVTLKFRTSANSGITPANLTYAGGAGVGSWTEIPMTGTAITAQTNPAPLYKALEYSGQITGFNSTFIDYYVEAVDNNANIARSPIGHVWVGANGSGGSQTGINWAPANPAEDDSITITVTGATQGAKLHWGVNNVGSSWTQPDAVYWPSGSMLFLGTGPAVETAMNGPDSAGTLRLTIGPFNNPSQQVQRVAFVLHYNNNTWDNNSGQDYHITVSGPPPPTPFIMDGAIDQSAQLAVTANGLDLYVGWNGADLYVATQSAQMVSGDMFILISDSLEALQPAMWGKGGQVPGWKMFLGNESTNNWSGWFNGTEGIITNSAVTAAGSIVEGSVSLPLHLGTVPEAVYIAVGKYQTPDAGALLAQAPAGNGNGSIDTSEFFYYDFTPIAAAPLPPVLLTPAQNAANQPLALNLRWKRPAGAATFRAQMGTDTLFIPPLIVDDSTLIDTLRAVSGLEHSTEYFWRVLAKNDIGSSAFSQVRKFTTVVAAPPAPVVILPEDGADSVMSPVMLLWQNVGAAEIYRVQLAYDSLFTMIAVNDSSVTDTSFSTGPLADGLYFWRVAAGNAGGSGPYSPFRRFTVAGGVVGAAVSFTNGWNLVSLPLIVPDGRRTVLFPESVSSLFSYSPATGYVTTDSFRTSVGYWMKVPGTFQDTILGEPVERDTIELVNGWNLIGTITTPVPVASVVADPPGLPASSFFGFAGGYVVADTLFPGKAYWIKASGQGTVILIGAMKR